MNKVPEISLFVKKRYFFNWPANWKIKNYQDALWLQSLVKPFFKEDGCSSEYPNHEKVNFLQLAFIRAISFRKRKL